MVQDVRSSASEVVFDLLTPDGVMRALAVVRASTLTAEAKRELRDLIFSYTSSGGDHALRTLIESELAGLTPAVVEEPRVANPESVTAPLVTEAEVEEEVPNPVAVVVEPSVIGRAGFRTGRPAPRFDVIATAGVPLDVASESLVPAEIAKTPDSVADTPEPRVVTQSLPTPDPQPVPMVPKSVVDEKLAEITPPSEPTVEFKAPYREDASSDKARDRINAIKQMINTKVGNPVNLVDMDNTIGRAYMTSLLEAMKAVSGGGGDVTATMARLEEVVVEVEKLFATQSEPVSAAPVSPTVAAPIAPVVPVTATPVPVVTPRIEATIPQKALAVSEAVSPTVRSSVPVMSADTTVITPMAIASSRFKNVLPVTDQEPLKTPADLPTAAEVKARSGITDPLEDPDVDLGLEQLLGEWSLFKKSGMFGTGPKGRQHPLFIKLATIQMPLILSGRFEGSTSEIRQSITDYMNGWRYEQGIIYEQDETFEHYLRRVIRHIIDSQTRRRGA
jgi:hypothetical protein